jgi:hypothetical protein
MAVATNYLQMETVAQMLLDVGFTGDAAVVALAIIWGESGGNAWALNLNTHDPDSPSYLSLDRGLVQWNDYWWPDFRTVDAMDPSKAVKKMFEVSNGTDFSPWNVYESHRFVRFVPDAIEAFNNLAV